MPTYQRSSIYTVSDIEAVADHAGSYFFKPDTMRFFNSRILTGIIALDGHKAVPGARFLFITSERYEDEPRHYTVRMATLGTQQDDQPRVDIDSNFDEHYATAEQARKAMKKYADKITA